jgi:hypothetical protein
VAVSTLTVVKEVDPDTAKAHEGYGEKDEWVYTNFQIVNSSETSVFEYTERCREGCLAIVLFPVHR